MDLKKTKGQKCIGCCLKNIFQIDCTRFSMFLIRFLLIIAVLATGFFAPILFDGHSKIFHDYATILIIALLLLFIEPQPILRCIAERINSISLPGIIDLKMSKVFDKLAPEKDETVESENSEKVEKSQSTSKATTGKQSEEHGNEKRHIKIEDVKKIIRAKRRIVSAYLAICGVSFIKGNDEYSSLSRRYAGYFMQDQYCNIVAARCAAYNSALEIARKTLQDFRCDICQFEGDIRRRLKLTLCLNCPEIEDEEKLKYEIYEIAEKYQFPFSLYIDTQRLD